MQEVVEELRSALHTVWNRRWLALAVAWAVCILGWLAVAFIPNSYESRARIYVELEDVLSEQLEISGDGRQAITKVRQTLVSAVNLERVVRSTKLGEKVATDNEMQSAVQSLTENIVVESEQDNLFTITATVGKSSLSDAENAALAKDVVQKLIDIFVESNLVGDRNNTSQSLSFLDRQLDERQKQLQAAEAKRAPPGGIALSRSTHLAWRPSTWWHCACSIDGRKLFFWGMTACTLSRIHRSESSANG